MSNNREKTVVVGLDALDFKYLDKFQSVLPNITQIRNRGLESSLNSTIPPWTPSAWPSMYTGVNPSNHGVYGFYKYDTYPDDGRLVTRSDVESPAIWNYLSENGISSVVLNVPVTHPAEPIDGTLIPGYLASEDEPGYPYNIRETLSEALGEKYRIYSENEKSDDLDERLQGYLSLIDLRKRAAIELLTNNKWEFAFVQVQKTDTVFHSHEDEQAFRAVYRAADDLVGTLLESIDEPVNVIICSDHGIGPVHGYQLHPNEVLREHGYVATTQGRNSRSLVKDKYELIDNQSTDSTADNKILNVIEHKIKGVLGNRSLRLKPLLAICRSLGIESHVVKIVPKSLCDVLTEDVDWQASKAYCQGGSRLGVRVNLQGREPNGKVTSDEYEKVREDIIDILSSMTTPDGQPAFETVKRREEVHEGSAIENAPDIVFIPNEMNNTVSHTLFGQTYLSISRHDHKRDGVFIGAGPAFNTEWNKKPLSLTDIAPIIMALRGVPVPARMDGRVPSDLLTVSAETNSYQGIEFGKGGVQDDYSDEEVTERLQDLGYL